MAGPAPSCGPPGRSGRPGRPPRPPPNGPLAGRPRGRDRLAAARRPAPTGLTVDEDVRAAGRSLAGPVRVVGTARSARLAEAGPAVLAVRSDPAAAPLGFPPVSSAADPPDPYVPLSVPPPALAAWAAIYGLGPLDQHPAAPVARFLGVPDYDLAVFAALVRNPRWFRSADPERPLAAGRLYASLRLKGRDRPGAVVR